MVKNTEAGVKSQSQLSTPGPVLWDTRIVMAYSTGCMCTPIHTVKKSKILKRGIDEITSDVLF